MRSREAGDEAEADDEAACDGEGFGLGEHLGADFFTEGCFFVGGDTGDDDTGGDGDEEGRDLGNEAVADGEDTVGREGFHDGEVFLGDTDSDTGDDVDGGDDEAGDGVAFNEFHGTVHGAVELVFFFECGAASAGLFNVDDAGAHIGVDTHLFTGHSVEGEACGDFGDPFGTFGDNDELDD